MVGGSGGTHLPLSKDDGVPSTFLLHVCTLVLLVVLFRAPGAPVCSRQGRCDAFIFVDGGCADANNISSSVSETETGKHSILKPREASTDTPRHRNNDQQTHEKAGCFWQDGSSQLFLLDGFLPACCFLARILMTLLAMLLSPSLLQLLLICPMQDGERRDVFSRPLT